LNVNSISIVVENDGIYRVTNKKNNVKCNATQ
jgi:hypothetical protein